MQMPLFEWHRDLSLTIVDSGYACGYRTTGRDRSYGQIASSSAIWRLDKLTFYSQIAEI